MRYWKLISITAMVLLIIGTYYIQSVFAESGKPEFILQTENGKSELAQSLLLKGHYLEQGQREFLQISSDGTLYQNELPYFNRLMFGSTDPYIVNLQEEYRNFMRGKGGRAGPFYENQSMLIYAQIATGMEQTNGQMKLSFEVMQKDSRETSSLLVNIPKQQNYDFLIVEDIKAVNGELKVTTQNLGRRQSEYHVYTIDIGQEQVVEDTLIGLDSEEQAETGNINHVFVLHGPSDYLVLQQEKQTQVPLENGDVHIEPVGTEFITHHLETDEQAKLEVPDSFQESIQAAVVSGSTVYFFIADESGTKLVALDIATEEIVFQTTFELPVNGGEMRSQLMKATEDHIYLVTPYQDKAIQAAVLAIDAATGELVYEGTIGTEQNEEELPNYTVEINEIAIQ